MAASPGEAEVQAAEAVAQMERAAAMMEQNDVSEVDDDDSESEGSAVSATTRMTRTGSARSRTTCSKTKKKIIKKKKKTKDDGSKDCWGCTVQSLQDDELQEYWRRKLLAQDNTKAATLGKIRQRWGRPEKENGDASGEQCYYCRRTIRAFPKYSSMQTKDLRKKLETPKDDDDKALKVDFAADRQCVMGLLAAEGPDHKITPSDLDQVAEVWMEEVAGEETSADGIKMDEDVFKRKFTDDEKKINYKREQVKDVKTGKMKSIARIFDEEEGVDRFRLFTKRQAVKRLKLGDSDLSSMQDMDKFFEAVACSIGPAGQKGYLTAADVKEMEGYLPMSKAQRKKEADAKKKKKLDKRDSNESSDASHGPLLAATLSSDAKPKAKAKSAKASSKNASLAPVASSSSGPQAKGSSTSLSGLRFCVPHQTAWFRGSSENIRMHGGLF